MMELGIAIGLGALIVAVWAFAYKLHGNRFQGRINRITPGGKPRELQLTIDYSNDNHYQHTITDVQLELEHPELGNLPFARPVELDSYDGDIHLRHAVVPGNSEREVRARFTYEGGGKLGTPERRTTVELVKQSTRRDCKVTIRYRKNKQHEMKHEVTDC